MRSRILRRFREERATLYRYSETVGGDVCASRKLWKSVPLSKLEKRSPVFEASYRGSVYSVQNVCLLKSHILFGMTRENAARMWYHAGQYGSFRDEACIGKNVVRLLWTAHDRERQREKATATEKNQQSAERQTLLPSVFVLRQSPRRDGSVSLLIETSWCTPIRRYSNPTRPRVGHWS